MSNLPIKKIRIGLLALICTLVITMLSAAVVVGRPRLAPAALPGTIVCTNGPTFDLETSTGYYSTPDGNEVYMWSFTEEGQDFQTPGPILCVEAGQTVTVNLTNTLDEPVSIVFPGQTEVTATGDQTGLFTEEAAPNGGTASYSFVATEPGTYLYESGTSPYKQVHMGLYGALIVRPAGHANWVYNNSTTQFDTNREYLLLLHEIDPDLHAAVERGEPYQVTTQHDRYWTINGRSFPDTIADNFAEWLPNQPYGALVQIEASADANTLPALIRYANAGLDNHPFHPHGNHMRMIGRDGRLLSSPQDNFTTTIGSGQTYDLFFRWIDVEAWDQTSNPIPVLYPDQPNLIFKDGVTFYSSDPYLGQPNPGEPRNFPPGVTSFNECGEFYFPWHSHALQEVQNYDEGFGGMLTLVRVDPPGGCP